VVIPSRGYPIWPLYFLSNDWKRNKMAAHPIKRVYDGIVVFHPRITSPKPSRFFKIWREYYIETVVTFLNEKIGHKKDIYLFAQWLPEAGMVVDVARILGVKVAVMGIGDDILKFPYRSALNLIHFKNCWENANLRGVVADYLGKAANSIAGVNLPYEVFYSSVNEEEFFPVSTDEKIAIRQELGFPQEKIIILCVGSPIVRKGWLDLFEALKEINFDNFLLLGVNGGKKELNLKLEARNRGLQNNFLDCGEVPAGSINRYYQLADIFCLPSHWEGLANALLEAMSTGLPCVTTNVSGHPEVINDGENGFMINIGDIEQLRIILQKLLLDQSLRLRLGSSASHSVKSTPGSHIVTAQKIIDKLKIC